MSSILEALKKLEADKNAQQVPVDVPEPVYTPDYMTSSILGNFAEPAADSRRLSPVALVLGGSLFTLLLIVVSVVLALFLVRALQEPAPPAERIRTAGAAPAQAPAAAIPTADPEVAPASTVDDAAPAPLADTSPEPAASPQPAIAPAPVSAPRPARQQEEEMVTTPVPVTAEVRYEPYIPKPAAAPASGAVLGDATDGGSDDSADYQIDDASNDAPLPADLRSLPMLSREERGLYGLEEIKINMLNEASPTRPLGNALINLEKIFIGETLPGSNARLVDVKSYGIAVEILSTRQRYYVPR